MSSVFRPSQTNLRVTQVRGAMMPIDRDANPRSTLRGDFPIPEAARPDAQARPTLAVAPERRATGPVPEIQLLRFDYSPAAQTDTRIVVSAAPDSPRAAAFRVLRHHLMEHGRPQTIVVASPNRGEGKTTAALNLALALSECNRARVLLLEANLRRPALAGILGFTPPRCFAAEMAEHRANPLAPWSFVDVPQMWLHVGAIDPRSERDTVLDGPAFANALDRLRLASYDHIVIDGPAVLGSADVNLMADAADAVVLALRGKRSTLRDVRDTMGQLGEKKIAGTVLLDE